MLMQMLIVISNNCQLVLAFPCHCNYSSTYSLADKVAMFLRAFLNIQSAVNMAIMKSLSNSHLSKQCWAMTMD